MAGYKLTDYHAVNGVLRGERTIVDEPQVSDIVKHLDSALASASLPEEVWLYRGMRWSDGVPASFMDAKVGDALTNPSYVSTAMNGSFAKNFVGDDPKRAVLLNVHAPAGTRAISMDQYGRTTKETELLFPRGTEMFVTNRSVTNGVLTFDVEARTPPVPVPAP